jgi:predicted aldo/keto reductase-like oxidoreductase
LVSLISSSHSFCDMAIGTTIKKKNKHLPSRRNINLERYFPIYDNALLFRRSTYSQYRIEIVSIGVDWDVDKCFVELV